MAALSLMFLAAGVGSAVQEVWVGGLVQVLLGVLGWWSSRTVDAARSYLVWAGLLYLVLTLTGVVSMHAAVQAVVAVAMIVGGFIFG